ncbi:MAG: energy transducer TonB, partial [Acetobacter sp.]
MTNELEQQKKKAQRYDLEVGTAVIAGAFIVVLFLHILGIWGLISRMGKGDSPPPPARPPIQTRVLPPPPPPP